MDSERIFYRNLLFSIKDLLLSSHCLKCQKTTQLSRNLFIKILSVSFQIVSCFPTPICKDGLLSLEQVVSSLDLREFVSNCMK